MDRPFPASARPALIALALLLTVACTGSTAMASTPAPPSVTDPGNRQADPGGGGGTGPGVVKPGPDDPIATVPTDPTPVDPDSWWQTIQARHDLQNLHAQAWDHVSLSPDGRTLTVYFWGGVQGCYGLADVQVSRTTGGVATVTLITGTPPAMGDFACIDVAAAYKTIVQLDEPLIVDGSGAPAAQE